MTVPAQDLPPEFTYGKVMARIVLAVGDTSDEGDFPDEKPATGKVTITPKEIMRKAQLPEPTTVIAQAIPCTLDSEGFLVDPDGKRGVWLITGTYTVAYNVAGVTLQGHEIVVTTAHTAQTPLWLTNAQPPGGATLTVTQYAELSARLSPIEAMRIVASPDGTLSSTDATWYDKAKTDELLSEKLDDAAAAALAADTASALGASLSSTYVAMAPKPTGVKATDEANLQPLIDAAQATGGTVHLQAGTYVGDFTTSRTGQQPRIIGKGERQTKIDGKVTLVGTPGSFSGGYLSDLTFIGTRSVAMEINGATAVKWDRLRFDGTFDTGLLFRNNATSLYTEHCAGQAHFAETVKTALEYRVDAGGNPSFHGCGLTEGSTINQSATETLPKIKIGAGAQPYNAPMSVTMWARNGTPLVQHNGEASCHWYGAMKVELLPPNPYCVIVDPTTKRLPFVGGLTMTGKSVKLGSLVLADSALFESGVVEARVGGAIPTDVVGAVLRTTPEGPAWMPKSRTNLASNPGVENNTSFWSAYWAPTVSRSSDWAAFGTYSFKAVTVDTAKLEGIAYLEAMSGLTTGDEYTVAVTLRSSVDLVAYVTGRWGLSGSPGTADTDGEVVYLTANEPKRVVRHVTVPPPNPAGTVTHIGFTFRPNTSGDIPAAGSIYYADAVTIERGTTDGSYFDGEFDDGEWLGASGGSKSVLWPSLPPGLRGVYRLTAAPATVTLPQRRAFHEITMTANTTFTFEAPTGRGHRFLLKLSGSFAPTWPASVDWPSGAVPAYAATSVYEFVTFDQGVNWFGRQLGASYA